MRFPGRRGQADLVDFHLLPLSFREAVRLRRGDLESELAAVEAAEREPAMRLLDELFAEFDRHLAHGGFLTAINDLEREDRILPATFATYSDWIRGDVLKRGKQEHYLREVLGAIVRRAGGQVTWAALASDLSIDHPKTVADYVSVLESMDVARVQHALIEHRLAPAPKKARKVSFSDPFIHHAVRSWLDPVADPFAEQVAPALADPARASWLVEACAAHHLSREHPTYYIKAEGEVDIAYVHDGTFWPVEVKWTRQLRPKDLKQVVKYDNARIWGLARSFGELQGVPVEPLPWALFRLG